MGRALIEPLALFLSPFAAYAVYLILRARYPLEIEHWTSVPGVHSHARSVSPPRSSD